MSLLKRIIFIVCVGAGILLGLSLIVVGVFSYQAFSPKDFHRDLKLTTEQMVRETLHLNIPREDYPHVRFYGYTQPIAPTPAFVRYTPPHKIPAALVSELEQSAIDPQDVMLELHIDHNQTGLWRRYAEESGWDRIIQKRNIRFFHVSVQEYSGESSGHTTWQGIAVLDTSSNTLMYRFIQ